MKLSMILKAWTKYGVPYWYIAVENDAGNTVILCSDLQYMFDTYEEAEVVLMAAKIRGDVQ